MTAWRCSAGEVERRSAHRSWPVMVGRKKGSVAVAFSINGGVPVISDGGGGSLQDR
jgi:hypothetical protein